MWPITILHIDDIYCCKFSKTKFTFQHSQNKRQEVILHKIRIYSIIFYSYGAPKSHLFNSQAVCDVFKALDVSVELCSILFFFRLFFLKINMQLQTYLGRMIH